MKILNTIILIAFLVTIVGCSNNVAIDKGPEELAKCLTDKGAVMYGAEWCGHCKNQKSNFGESFQYINYVDCDEEESKCRAAGIRGYPTWVIETKLYPGEKSLNRLADITGCN